MAKEIFESGTVGYLLPPPPQGGEGIMSFTGGDLSFGTSADYSATVSFGDASVPVTLNMKRAGSQVHVWISAPSLQITPQGSYLYGTIMSATPIPANLLPPTRAALSPLAFVKSDLTITIAFVTIDYLGAFCIGAYLDPGATYYIGGLQNFSFGVTSAYLGSFLA